jgi:sugar phosphate isomerase/epimerase
MNPVAFITANYVARPLGYRMTRGWAEGDTATNDLYRPLETFAGRFDDLVARIKALGFLHLDLWCAHLHPAWATPRHLDLAREALARHEITVTAYACHWGRTADELLQVVRVAQALNCPLVSGSHGLLRTDRARLVGLLRDHGARLAYENHPETGADEILAVVGDGDAGTLGVAFDTGWAGTRGFDAVAAARRLAPRLMHLHAKDVLARRPAARGLPLADLGHETCALGDGVVSVEAAIKEAVRLGFQGPIGIEHEPEDHDPEPEIATSFERLRRWLGETATWAKAAS